MASLQSRRASAHWRATLATDCESVSDSTDRVSVSDSCSFRMSLTYSDSPFPSRRPSRRRFSNLAERLSFSAHTPPWPLIASLSQTAPQSRLSFLILPAFRALIKAMLIAAHPGSLSKCVTWGSSAWRRHCLQHSSAPGFDLSSFGHRYSKSTQPPFCLAPAHWCTARTTECRSLPDSYSTSLVFDLFSQCSLPVDLPGIPLPIDALLRPPNMIQSMVASLSHLSLTYSDSPFPARRHSRRIS
jgi:hypothetical protein